MSLSVETPVLTCQCMNESQPWPSRVPEEGRAFHACLGLALVLATPNHITTGFLDDDTWAASFESYPALTFIPNIEQLLCLCKNKPYVARTLTH